MHSLLVSNITKTYGAKMVLNHASLQLHTGDIVGIFGSNGTGKSTLLKIVFGTEEADSLQLTHNSKTYKVKDVIPGSLIAYLPQDPFLPKSFKVRDIIPLYYSDGDLQNKIFYAPGIGKIANTAVGRLSMGELRYLELLMVGNLNHPFLMLDEPFSMIEPLYKDLIKEFLNKVKTKKGIIITDHYYKDVLAVTTRNLLLKNGGLLPVDNEAELIAEGYLPL